MNCIPEVFKGNAVAHGVLRVVVNPCTPGDELETRPLINGRLSQPQNEKTTTMSCTFVPTVLRTGVYESESGVRLTCSPAYLAQWVYHHWDGRDRLTVRFRGEVL